MAKYQSVTCTSVALARAAAPSTVTGAGTITSRPGFQSAGQATPLASTVCSASTTRRI